MSLLEKINLPRDLRELSVEEAQAYSIELRQFLIESMAKNGGHVAANLGVVELSVALHYSFNTPADKIVWDVGHQAYSHKIITGRRHRFQTLRQDGGLSGFTKISESEYDSFGAGHSSTALSAGLGLAEGEWQKKSGNVVVSVVGDGALTAGISFEALNHGGALKRSNHIIVINDNEMSISENVGAVARFFGQKLNGETLLERGKGEIKNLAKVLFSLSLNGQEKLVELKNIFQKLFFVSSFFESLGFDYVGPIDGHEVNALASAFKDARARAFTDVNPLIIHVKTKKGFGLKAAEESPGDFHGVTGFSLKTGLPFKKVSRAPSYTGVFSQTLSKMAEKDPQIVAVTAAMAEGTGLSQFEKKFPKRFYDVGIAEQHAVTFAAALRLTGLKPAVAIYSTFLQRAYDQVIHDVALQKIPLALFLDRAGLVGADGPTHHGVFDLSFLRCVPGITIMAPKDENELQHMIFTALNLESFVAVRFPRGEGFGIALDAELKTLTLGKSEKVLSENTAPTVTIWAIGSCVYPSVEAAKELHHMGILCDVVNARFVKPLDGSALVTDAKRSKLLVTVEENTVIGGFGSAVLEHLGREGLLTATLTLGVADHFVEHGQLGRQRADSQIDHKGIVDAVLKKLEQLPESPAASAKKSSQKKSH